MRPLAFLLSVVAAAGVSAQETKTPATKAPATKVPATQAPATKTPVTQAPATKAPTTKTAAPTAATKAGPATKTQGVTRRGPAVAVAPDTSGRVRAPVIMREAFDYVPSGRRDPFFSLLATAELRPTVTDLRLVGILFDESGRRPVAIMRDVVTNTQYRVTTGMTLGRMRVAQIKRKAVIFTIEEFGLNRQDSLFLGDTSKARAR